MSVRSNYLTAFTLHGLAVLAYVLVPAFPGVLRGWYLPGFIVLALTGLWISFAFTCPARGLSVAWRGVAWRGVAWRKIPFNGLVVHGYLFWPPRRCTSCEEPLE